MDIGSLGQRRGFLTFVQVVLNCIVLLMILTVLEKECLQMSHGKMAFLIVTSVCLAISGLLLLAMLFGSDETETLFGTFYSLVAYFMLIPPALLELIYRDDCNKKRVWDFLIASAVVQIVNAFIYLYQFIHSLHSKY